MEVITNVSNERMRAALELLQLKADRVKKSGEEVLLDETDVDEVILVAGMNNKEIEII